MKNMSQGQKSSLTSGKRPSENCIRTQYFLLKKTSKQTNKKTRTKKKEKRLKKLAGCKFWDLQWDVYVSDWI